MAQGGNMHNLWPLIVLALVACGDKDEDTGTDTGADTAVEDTAEQ